MPAISPAEARARTGELIPEEVLEIINGFLIGYSRSPITIHREELVGKISTALDIDRNEISKRRYLEFAEVYRAQGWSVVFEAPDRGESGYSYWRFSAAS